MPEARPVFAANEAATEDRTATSVRFAANVEGPGRTERLMGKDYRVLPATLVRSQVLNNNIGRCFLPADAITPAWAEVANGAPVLIDHPTRDGQPISGRDPEVLNGSGTGFLFRARAQNGTLKADVYLDEGRADDVEGLAAILEKLDAGETVELSTGFPAMGEEVQGVHNGEEYDLVLYPTGFDHLAVFADKVGACSVDDGCGLGALNEGTTETRSIVTRVMAAINKALGPLANQDEWSLDDTREAVADAAERRWGGGPGRWVWVAELFDDDAVISVDRDGEPTKYYRAPYTVDREARTAELGDAIEVERITEFVPVESDGATSIQARHEYLATNTRSTTTEVSTSTPEGGDNMKRDELIAALCGCDKVAFRRETLEAMTDEELAHVATANEVGETGPEDETAESVEDEPEDKPGATEATEGETPEVSAETENMKALQASVKALTKQVQELKEATEPTRNEQAAERKRLAGDIAANSDFEEGELKDRPLSELRKLHKATCQKPANFAGMGLPRRSDPSTRSVDLGFEPKSTLTPASQTKNQEN